ncbi:MAG: NHLP leader peptide family RiPP precursor [Bacteroidota bacterium]
MSVVFELSGHYINEDNRDDFKALVTPLVERAYEDAAFKQEFIANPEAVILRETGTEVDLPEKCEFVVIDKSNPFALYVTLPVNEEMLELTDEELELVAGGGDNVLIKINFNCKKACGKKAKN